MIGYLKGEIISIKSDEAIVDVGGVGYRVNLVAFGVELGDIIEMFIYTSVSEKDISLYGFKNNDDFEAFEILLSVSGIGPKKAMGLLTRIAGKELFSAILNEDKVTLKSAGISAKTVDKILVELKDKLKKMGLEDGFKGVKNQIDSSTYIDIIEALSTLGYKKGEIDEAIQNVDLSKVRDSQKIIKELLNYLRKR